MKIAQDLLPSRCLETMNHQQCNHEEEKTYDSEFYPEKPETRKGK